MILIVVKHHVRQEYADDWLSRVHGFTVSTRAEPGNISFEWYRSADDPTLWLLVEAFHDAEAGEAHVSSPHFQEAMNQVPQWLADVPEIIHVETPDGWARMSEMRIEPRSPEQG